MTKRHMVQIPAEQVAKLKDIEGMRKDLAGYTVSKKVHILLQEKISEIMKGTIPSMSAGNLKGDWFEYIRNVIPVHILAPLAIGIVRNSQEMIGTAFTRILDTNDSSKTWWCNYKEDIYNVGNYILKNFKDDSFKEEYYGKYNLVCNETRDFCHDLISEDFSKIDDAALLSKYNIAFEKFKRFHALTFDIDAMDIVLEEKMKEKLVELMMKKNPKYKKTELSSKYTLLTSPIALPVISEEQLEVYRLVRDIFKDKKIVKLFEGGVQTILKKLEKSILQSRLASLVKKYWWITLGWTDREEKREAEYTAEIKKFLKLDFEDKIIDLENYSGRIKKEKNGLGKALLFDKEMEFLLDIFEHYAVFHDYRKEIQMKSTHVMNKFLFEISRRFGQKYIDLVWCWPWEIKAHIKSGEIDIDKIRERKESFLFLVTEDSIEQYTGEEAMRRRKKELAVSVEDIHDFKGQIGYAGKVTGRAKICFSLGEAMHKIAEGDILVASMTTPEYLPAMKKASAIVTDEGGVTCHAAIVSRELKIPSIVGTRIATRAIQDGDLIEVNANHGTVKILERK